MAPLALKMELVLSKENPHNPVTQQAMARLQVVTRQVAIHRDLVQTPSLREPQLVVERAVFPLLEVPLSLQLTRTQLPTFRSL